MFDNYLYLFLICSNNDKTEVKNCCFVCEALKIRITSNIKTNKVWRISHKRPNGSLIILFFN